VPKPAPPPPPPAPVLVEESEEVVDIPLEVESGGEENPPLSLEAEAPALDLGEESASEPELSGAFLEEEPALGGDLDLSLEEAEPAPEPAPEPPAPEPPLLDMEPAQELSLAVESEELPFEEPPPPPPRPAPRSRPPAAPAQVKPAPAPAPQAPPPPPAARKSPAPPPPPPRPAPPPPAPSGLPADLQKVLDEVDSYISLGFVEDAKEALREVGLRYPGHQAILEKIEALGLDQEVVEEAPAVEIAVEEPPLAPPARRAPAPAPSHAAPAPAPPVYDPMSELGLPEPEVEAEAEVEVEAPPEPTPLDAGGIDLGAELDGLFGAHSAVEEPPPAAPSTDLGDAGLAEIFKEFKKGVDKQLGKEDYDTRYNLGIAYKEMGLIDEAIAEFQLAARDEARLLECASMLGICFLEKGMPKLAVKWFEKALKAQGRTEEEYQGLRYDLATAYEAAGEIEKALSLFTDLYGQDANFRDVAAKVRELRAAHR
jgi:tetratricopeptide (TPR) repeat protein